MLVPTTQALPDTKQLGVKAPLRRQSAEQDVSGPLFKENLCNVAEPRSARNQTSEARPLRLSGGAVC
jgi:hypothetical protein